MATRGLGRKQQRRCPPLARKILSEPRYWPDPDFYLYPAHLRAEDVRGPDVLLVIEISDPTLSYDLGRKAKDYRKHGVRGYWVLDVNKRETHVHRLAAAHAWPAKPATPFDQALQALSIPGIAVSVSTLT